MCIMYLLPVPNGCGRGDLSPQCNAQSYVDDLIMSKNHMYWPANGGGPGASVTYQRMPECSACAPGKCPRPANASVPDWCLGTVPFDPEGLVSSLTAMSGQTASFLAGGEFPIPVPQGGGGSNTSVTIEYKEFGIRLSLTPTVLGEDRIVLKVAPEVSELDFDSSVTLQGTTVPGIRVRRTDTTVQLGDGESFVLSGLVDQDLAASVDKVPWLGDLPFIGAFFRNTRYDRQDRELIMVVTPHLVTPLARGTDVPLPGEAYDDYDPDNADLFFRETGDFEPRSGRTGFSR